jgi:NADH dehydrogenase
MDPESLRPGLAEAQAVIHLVGIISEAAKVTFENLHTVATRNVVKAMRAAGVKRLLHMSALGTRPGAPSRYHATKWAAEEAVRQSGVAFTIFRPSLVYGPEDHFVNLFASMARFSPVLPIMGSGKARFQPVPVEAVGKAFTKALCVPATLGQTYDLCGPDTLTLGEILRDILSATRRKRIRLRVPLPIARLQAALLETVYPLIFREPPPLNRDQLLMLEEDNVCDGHIARELLGLDMPRFREGIARYLSTRGHGR